MDGQRYDLQPYWICWVTNPFKKKDFIGVALFRESEHGAIWITDSNVNAILSMFSGRCNIDKSCLADYLKIAEVNGINVIAVPLQSLPGLLINCLIEPRWTVLLCYEIDQQKKYGEMKDCFCIDFADEFCDASGLKFSDVFPKLNQNIYEE
jgi:hypothetical protein